MCVRLSAWNRRKDMAVSRSFSLPECLSTYLSVCLSIYLFVGLSVCLSTYLFASPQYNSPVRSIASLYAGL